MIWRLHADIYFTTAQRRTQFVNAWTSWAASKGTMVVNDVQAIDEEDGVSMPRPLLRFDVSFLNDQVNVDAHNYIRGQAKTYIVYVLATIHRCGVGNGNPPLPDGPVESYTYGTRP